MIETKDLPTNQGVIIDQLAEALTPILTMLSAPQEAARPDDELNIPEVASLLHCSASTVKSLLGNRGGPVVLPHFKRHHRVYVLRGEVERYRTDTRLATSVMRTPRSSTRTSRRRTCSTR